MGLARQDWYSACISRAIARESANKEKGVPIPSTGFQKRCRSEGPTPKHSVQGDRKRSKNDLRKNLKESY